MPVEKLSISMSPEALGVVDARSDGGVRNRSSVIALLVQRYESICRRAQPELDVAEWKLCCDALNGCLLVDPPHSYEWVVHEISDAISLNKADVKWSVNGPALLRKLQDAGPAGRLALVDVAERFWAAVARGEDPLVPGETRDEQSAEANDEEV